MELAARSLDLATARVTNRHAHAGRAHGGREALDARRTGPAERVWRWCRRNPSLAFLTGSIAGLLITVAVVSILYSARLRQQVKINVRTQQKESDARKVAELRLWDAYLAEISAQTAGRHLGRRFAALDTSERASALLDQIGRTPERELKLRSATIAAATSSGVRRPCACGARDRSASPATGSAS